MDEIAELAGASKPLVHLYLNSKEDLFTACIRRETAALTAAVRSGVRTGLRTANPSRRGRHGAPGDRRVRDPSDRRRGA